MKRAIQVEHWGHWPADSAVGRVTLAYDDRHRRRLRLTTEGGIDFLMIARLVRYKGVFEFCEAARALRARGAQARFRLIGGVESGPAAFKPAEIARFGDAVEYLGPRTDIAAQIAAAHIYVLPSYGEGMPRTVLEALAVGRPVITTDVAGCRSTVLPGVNGTLVPPRDAEALRQAMEGFLKRPDRIAPMAAASRARSSGSRSGTWRRRISSSSRTVGSVTSTAQTRDSSGSPSRRSLLAVSTTMGSVPGSDRKTPT